MSALPSFLRDPHLARRLARASWVVLVAAFVLLTRFDPGSALRHAAVAFVVVLVFALNVPVMVGLYESRAESHTPAFRMVAFALLVRLLATVWICALVAAP